MEEINPLLGEQIPIAEEIRAELEQLEIKKSHLLELLEYYE